MSKALKFSCYVNLWPMALWRLSTRLNDQDHKPEQVPLFADRSRG